MIPRELFRQIRRLEIRTKGLVDSFFGGEYHSAFKGRGMLFSEVRPYQYGDDVRTIDWNVSARSDEPYVKVFEEEREQTLLLVVDVSDSSRFGTQHKHKRDLMAEVCALVAFSAVQNNDKVGLLLFAGGVERFVPPQKGRRHVLRIVRDLYTHQTQTPGTNLAAALDHALHVLKRRAVVVVVSDFVAEGYERSLRILARRHDAVAIAVEDPRDADLPAVGLVAVRDAETGERVVLDTSSRAVRERYAHAAAQRRAQTEALFKRVRVDAVAISTATGYLDPLTRFFHQRTRRR